MIYILERIFVFICIVFVIIEILVPLILNTPIFGSFRKKKKVELKTEIINKDVTEKVKQAKEKVEQIKEVQKEVDEVYTKTKDLKNQSDNLLK